MLDLWVVLGAVVDFGFGWPDDVWDLRCGLLIELFAGVAVGWFWYC